MLIYRFERVTKYSKSSFKILKSNKGFSLIEILVALLLVVGVLALTGLGSNPGREKMEENLFLMERAVRFSNDESILRNAVTRIHFYLDKDPQEVAVEYGPDSDFVIPLSMLDQSNISNLSATEREDREKETSNINKDFNKVKEFQEDNSKIEDGVRLVALATTMNENILTEGEAAIYVYPNGEKDGAIIVFANIDEIASISFEPYSLDFTYNYFPITQEFLDEDERFEFIQNQAKEIVSKWQKR